MIQCFISRERVPELLNYIQNIVYNESSDAATTSSISSSAKPNILQNILLKCYIHQVLYVLIGISLLSPPPPPLPPLSLLSLLSLPSPSPPPPPPLPPLSLLSLPSLPQCLEGYGAPVQNSLTQFIHDKFLYDHKVAMDLLIQSGLLEPLLELAKVIT